MNNCVNHNTIIYRKSYILHQNIFEEEYETVLNHMKAFFRLLERSALIRELMTVDVCCLIADRYLIAMVFVYFMRARLSVDKDFNDFNFYVSLHLAHDMQEEFDYARILLREVAVSCSIRTTISAFVARRDALWQAMEMRANVERDICEKLMTLEPQHWAWKRCRQPDHAGAFRYYEERCCPLCIDLISAAHFYMEKNVSTQENDSAQEDVMEI